MNRLAAALLCALLLGLAGCATPTDIQQNAGSPARQRMLQAASDIRQLTGLRAAGAPARATAARERYEAGLQAWRDSGGVGFYEMGGFDQSFGKLSSAYRRFLLEANRPAEAAAVLRTAIAEADRGREYQPAIALRIELADVLLSIGQIESARAALDQAQGVVDKVYGKQPFAADPRLDPFKVADAREIFAARIRAGQVPDKAQLQAFVTAYEAALARAPWVRYFAPASSWMYTSASSELNDQKTYRQDQAFWQQIAQAAGSMGEDTLARSAIGKMLEAARASANNGWSQDKRWRDDYASQASTYRDNFYTSPAMLGLYKFADTASGREMLFDFTLAAAEQYLALGELNLAAQLLEQAQPALEDLQRFSAALVQAGMLGLKDEQRARELDRVRARYCVLSQRWPEALALLERYIAWSESYRDSLSLEERLPYFRGRSQAAYRDAILVRAELYRRAPGEAAFNQALDALARLKARHLQDSLGQGGQAAGAASARLAALNAAGSSFLSVADTGDALVSFLADTQGKALRIAPKPAGFERAVLTLRNTLADAARFDAEGARSLTVLALGEFEPRVFGARRLLVEIDGVLSFLPVELWLDAKKQALGASVPLTYIPSLAMLGNAPQPRSGQGILALGDARFDQQIQIDAINASGEAASRGAARGLAGFAALPETRDEVREIMQSVRGGGKPLFGAEATKSAFLREAAATPYRYLHFATHGVVGGEIPTLLEPALVLTPEGRDAGFLTASEISRLSLHSDLVVLSACNTGNGEYYNGEGLMGLGRAFLLAGARAVLVSLWPVDSLSTKDLMVRFYKELERGAEAGQALVNARRAVMGAEKGNARAGDFGGRRNPFYWAPFILVERSR